MLRLSLALGDYDLHRGLIEGRVGVDGCDVSVITCGSPERHWRFLRQREFDVCELSLGGYLTAHNQGWLTAVPVFPRRCFRHQFYFVRTGAGVNIPKDLEGRAVGLSIWRMTAALWMRGIVHHEYGVDLKRIRWVVQSEEGMTDAPVIIERAPSGKDPQSLLLEGVVDAVFYPDTMPAYRAGDPRVSRLFPNVKLEEQRYFERTGIFPIMHLLAMRRELANRHPWLPQKLITAWQTSRRIAADRMEDGHSVCLAWGTSLVEEERQVLGPDPWETGLTPGNRKALGTAIMYAFEQGMLPGLISPEELFWSPDSVDQ